MIWDKALTVLQTEAAQDGSKAINDDLRRKCSRPSPDSWGSENGPDPDLYRSREGRRSKISLFTERPGKPIVFAVTGITPRGSWGNPTTAVDAALDVAGGGGRGQGL